MLPFMSFAWCSSDSARGDFTFNGNIAWGNPTANGRFTNASKETYFNDFRDLMPVNE